jgi:tRNA1Val (adenine37-N6)-methyltransferase
VANDYFRFKQFTIKQGGAAFKVTTDSVLLGSWADFTNTKTILDIGTGTGLLALMAAQQCSAYITAIEPDRESFQQAVLNVSASSWADRITLYNCSLQEYIPERKDVFDVIISNPPYFTGSLLNPDPRKAMARHNTTLSVSLLLKASAAMLSENGKLILVLPAEDGPATIDMAITDGLYCNRLLYIKPSPIHEPRRLLISLSRTESEKEASILVIESEVRHNYSKEYSDLTRDFYLDK